MNRITAMLVGMMLAMHLPGVAQSSGAGPSPADTVAARFVNMQEVLEQAKAKVFPALVFVKPIVEDFDAGERRKHEVFGSGVILSPDGMVVTNNHVVDKAVKVHCVLFDKDQVSARILGRDPDTDLALLQLEVPAGKLPLPCGEFADSDSLTEGDFVMALGSPFGFTRSISLGIISNTQRYIGFETQYKYNTWLQTDAAINPGNSGGPLVNTEGKVVGINTLGIFLADNVGFAIPSNVVKDIVGRLAKSEEVSRAWSGLKLQPLKDFYTNTFTDADTGVLVSDVAPDSPGDNGGIRKGDILLSLGEASFDGTYAEALPGIERAIAYLPVDVPLAVTVLRNRERIECTVVLARKGKVEGDTFDCRRWNMTVKEINKFKEPDIHFYRNEGVFIQGVRYPGNANEAGLKRKDIITALDREPVTTLEEVEAIYEAVVGDEGRDTTVLVEILRGGYKKWISLDYTTDYDKED